MTLVDPRSRNEKSKRTERLLLAGCVSVCVLIALFGNLLVSHEQQYVFLAESFLRGKLYFTSMPESWHDTAPFAGRYYWPLGPLPAVLLAPLVLLGQLAGTKLYQGYVSLPVTLLTGCLCYRIARKCVRSPEDSIWLTLAFCGASSYVGVAVIPMSWAFAQVIAVCLLFLVISEWLGRRRWWLIGLLLALTASARLTAGLNIALFIGDALLCDKRQRLKTVTSLTAGFAVPMFFLAVYNFARFGSVIESGYTYQPPSPEDLPGVSLANVIPHLYIFLFGPPIVSGRFPFLNVDPVGMSVLLLSPWLWYLGSLKMSRLNYLGLVNCALVLVAVLAWRSTGQLQLGYRFILDFLPIVMLLLARDGFSERKIPLGFRILVCVGLFSSMYFLTSFIAALPQG